MTFSELRDLMFLYAADAVDDREREIVERWLASGDPVAAAVLAEARAMVAQLPMSLDPVAPDPRLWERLSQRIASEDSDETGGPIPIASGKSATPRRWAVPAAAAVAALVAAAGMFFALQPRIEDQRQSLADLRGELTRQEQALRELSTQLDAATLIIQNYEQDLEDFADLQRMASTQSERLEAQERRLEAQRTEMAQLNTRLTRANATVDLLQSPTLETVRLAGTDEMPDAAGRMLWDAQLGRLYFAGADFVPPDAEQTYQLWFVTDPDGPVSLGTFTVDADGRAVYDAELPDVDATIQVVAVSLEPAGGSPNPDAPSGPIVLAGQLGS